MEFDIHTTFGQTDVFCKLICLVSRKKQSIRPCLVGAPIFSFCVPGKSHWPMISRYYWAAACHGEEGIIRLVEQLNAELRLTMAQLGVAQVQDLTTRLGCWKSWGVFWGRFVWFIMELLWFIDI